MAKYIQEVANKQPLDCYLEAATNLLLAKNYQPAILLFEKAKQTYYNTPNISEYGLKEIDLYIIDYALVKCYNTDEHYFQKRKELLTMLGENRKKFPPLSYEYSLLLFEQHEFIKAESIINDTLYLVSNASELSSSKAYWPFSNTEILESDIAVLIDMLSSLKQKCETEINKQLKDNENLSDDGLYNSDSSSDKEQTLKNVCITKNAKKQLNISSSSSASSIELSRQKILEKSDANVKSSLIEPFKLKYDAPEFIPSSFDKHNNTEVKLAAKHKFNDTKYIINDGTSENVNKTDQVPQIENEILISNVNIDKYKSDLVDNVKVLTTKLIENIALHEQFQIDSLEKEEMITKNMHLILSQLTENQDLRNKIKALEIEVENQKEYSLELERHYAEEDRLKNRSHVKLEVLIEELQKALTKQEDIVKRQEQKIKFLELSLTEQFSRSCSWQKQEVVRQVNKCVSMISDLNTAIPYLTSTSAPTVDECRSNISQWEKQLKTVKQYSESLDNYFRMIFTQMCNDEYPLELNQPDMNADISELRDILHDNYVATVTYFIKSQSQNFHAQSAMVPNSVWYGKCIRPPSHVVPRPYYYNHFEGPSLYNRQTVENFRTDTSLIPLEASNVSNKLLTEISSKVIEQTSNNHAAKEITGKMPDLKRHKIVEIEPEHQTNCLVEKYSASTSLSDDSKNTNRSEHALKSQDEHLQLVKSIPQNVEFTDMKNIENSTAPDKADDAQVCNSTPSYSYSDRENDLINLNEFVKNKDVLQASDAAKAIGGPKFLNLFLYVKKKIANVNEEVLLNALKNVRQKKVKLSGMSREDIVKTVSDELKHLSRNQEVMSKPAWQNVKANYNTWQKDTSDNVCVICYEPYDTTSVTELKCQHSFHSTCIRKWFVTNSICPICRLHTTADEDFPPLV
ncbi:hypothetical protein RN001_002411 [Aquatica leii]|uniref:RING-type domain-containing protein n=1 Tax=Aquatica leii TaxID=1421715 RepID=A0AAN7SSU2_9COLE|nr:hypothetical protein RN001_002411 [Aquatica leii]